MGVDKSHSRSVWLSWPQQRFRMFALNETAIDVPSKGDGGDIASPDRMQYQTGRPSMSVVGQVESVWRYPVKSMRGEALPEIFVSFAGVYGDRLFAFKSAAAPAGFPYFTGRERHEMLLYCPRFRHPQKAALPSNLAAAEELAPGLNLNPVGANPADLAVDVETPSGKVLAIDDPGLLRELTEGAEDGHSLTLLRSERSMTDCRPISLFSLQTARQLGEEVGSVLDKRRFRANVYLDLGYPGGFSENGLVGRRLRIGSQVV